MSWTWGNKCTSNGCNGVNIYNSTCEKLLNCQWCKPPEKCFDCHQYSNLTHIYDPPTDVNTSISSRDSFLYELSGGMSLYNAHFRPSVVPAFGGNHLQIRLDSRNNISKNFQQKSY